MITGDSSTTALAIARMAGIAANAQAKVLSGNELGGSRWR